MSLIDPSEEVLADLIARLSDADSIDQLRDVLKTPVIFQSTRFFAFEDGNLQLTSTGVGGSILGENEIRWESIAHAEVETKRREGDQNNDKDLAHFIASVMNLSLQIPKAIIFHTKYGGSTTVDVVHLSQSKAAIPLLQSCIAVVARADAKRIGEELRNLEVSDTRKPKKSPMAFLKQLEQQDRAGE